MNIYAVTAANAHESSWGTYCPPQDSVDGKHVGSCLGDLFSVNWMEDSDKAKEMKSETLQEQYTVVAKETTKSQVMQFGDVTWTNELIAEFQGGNVDAPKDRPFWE